MRRAAQITLECSAVALKLTVHPKSFLIMSNCVVDDWPEKEIAF
jgi:hypothetical protein